MTKGWDQAAVDRANERRLLGDSVRVELPQAEIMRRLKAGIPIPIHSVIPQWRAVIDLDPIGAPRQTRRDAWKPSAAVQRYRAWKDAFRPACEAAGWALGPELVVEFLVEMPKSWSKKKRAEMVGQPHQQKPDLDNCCKSVMDAFGKDDGFVHTINARKTWATKERL